jgi:hypothetical protein
MQKRNKKGPKLKEHDIKINKCSCNNHESSITRTYKFIKKL